MADQPRHTTKDQGRAGGFLIPLGTIIALGCPAVLSYQAFLWSRNGRWPDIPIGRVWALSGLRLPGGTWEALPFLPWVLQRPASLGLLVAGGLLVMWGRLRRGDR
jgi:hypothetical protein